MNESELRSALGSAIGMIDYVVATLVRVEHGTARDIVLNAREKLKATSADLLVLRACVGELQQKGERV
jgi:hypothetical protein